ncbi:hypothetical protein PAXRUDRAFT_735937 [Paxillus rubicundulus Ve08.2h10]|uniref:Unplaced genomic scaffold scaffold_88, whole genome shotgun sequence n=1 Tax=Paxillus rubicundulus Ve08.2h10 TaxID=930991 RepID=A0A0D0DI98_9AGAM|nr:hypothetical protein PAXRUDRAFT_735937 [Paxillus rubicundulus Ve08.2h10]
MLYASYATFVPTSWSCMSTLASRSPTKTHGCTRYGPWVNRQSAHTAAYPRCGYRYANECVTPLETASRLKLIRVQGLFATIMIQSVLAHQPANLQFTKPVENLETGFILVWLRDLPFSSVCLPITTLHCTA